MTRFEKVQKLIGDMNKIDGSEVIPLFTIAPSSPYKSVSPSFLTLKASTDSHGYFVVNIEASIGCLTDRDRRFVDIDLYDKGDIKDLRDYLNYWLEEEEVIK